MIRETVLFANYTQAKLVLQKIAQKPHRHTARQAKGIVPKAWDSKNKNPNLCSIRLGYSTEELPRIGISSRCSDTLLEGMEVCANHSCLQFFTSLKPCHEMGTSYSADCPGNVYLKFRGP